MCVQEGRCVQVEVLCVVCLYVFVVFVTVCVYVFVTEFCVEGGV